MQIYLAKDGQRSGPLPLAEIRRQLQLGELRPDVPAWHQGLVGWIPLSALLSAQDGPVAETPPPLPAVDVKPVAAPLGVVPTIRIPRLTPPEAAPALVLAALVRPPSAFAPAFFTMFHFYTGIKA